MKMFFRRVCKWLVAKPLPLLCYCVVLLVWLVSCTVGLAIDSAQRANGNLAERMLDVDDFEVYAMQQLPDGAWRVYETTTETGAVTVDPQLMLHVEGGVVRSLRFLADYSGHGYEMNLYYTTRPGEAFSKNMRLWPVQQEDGSYLFMLPRKHIERLRLDPASAIVDIRFHEIVLNEQVPAYMYFNPGWQGLFLLAGMPALLAALLRWVADVVGHYKKRIAKNVTRG